ncbi:MAG: hydroxymyristoyl-ACP dehydratase [Acidiferrobacterales bacterium]
MKISGTHPALAGHFPGSPVVPGVVILDKVISKLAELKGVNVKVKTFPAIKFLNPIGPDEEFDISFTEKDTGKITFSVFSGDKIFLSGSLELK